MIILGIETSCDETALCLLEVMQGSNNDHTSPEGGLRYRILGNIVLSQIATHEQYGGVFPMLAKREHAKNIVPLLEKLINESGVAIEPLPSSENAASIVTGILGEHESDLLKHVIGSSLMKQKPAIDRIAVTYGPGLEPALWVGVNFTRALHKLWNVPVVTVNHMEGHIVSSLVESAAAVKPSGGTHAEFKTLGKLPLPSLALLISGGHTELVNIKSIGDYKIIGSTRDDAVGEAFDKVARMLGLPYPGGPRVSRFADEARTKDTPKTVSLPRPMKSSKDLDFSFAGLKTAVLYALQKIQPDFGNTQKPRTNDANPSRMIPDDVMRDICREFEDAVTEVLISKTRTAIETYTPHSLVIGGGVIANTHIRKAFQTLADESGIPLLLPHHELTGDNALMIALAGYYSTEHADAHGIKANGNLSL